MLSAVLMAVLMLASNECIDVGCSDACIDVGCDCKRFIGVADWR